MENPIRKKYEEKVELISTASKKLEASIEYLKDLEEKLAGFDAEMAKKKSALEKRIAQMHASIDKTGSLIESRRKLAEELLELEEEYQKKLEHYSNLKDEVYRESEEHIPFEIFEMKMNELITTEKELKAFESKANKIFYNK